MIFEKIGGKGCEPPGWTGGSFFLDVWSLALGLRSLILDRSWISDFAFKESTERRIKAVDQRAKIKSERFKGQGQRSKTNDRRSKNLTKHI
jgi:hypothetical protein